METTQEIIESLKKYTKTFNKLLEYFRELLKNPNFAEPQLIGLKPAQVVPHLVRFVELQEVNFLDALCFTNFNVFTLEYKILQLKTIIVCFHQLERGYLNFVPY